MDDSPGPDATFDPVRRVVLVGMMGAGKSTVGALVADRLEWRHLDIDREIERRVECSVAELFRREGEATFRAWESIVTNEVSSARDVVISSGGGWAAQSGLWERLAAGTVFVWLRVSAQVALARARAAPGERPLLAVADPQAELARLIEAREPAYRRAHLILDTDGATANELASAVEARVYGSRADGSPVRSNPKQWQPKR